MSERALVPEGKSLFYRSSTSNSGDNAVSSSAPDLSIDSATDVELTLEAMRQRLALHEKLSESVHQALENAVQLLQLAEQTRITAHQVADAALIDVRGERRVLSEENARLTRQRDGLEQDLARLREEARQEEARLKLILAQREAVKAELDELERQRHHAIENLQVRLASLARLQDSLRESGFIVEGESST